MTQTSTLAYTSETNKRDVDHREAMDYDDSGWMIDPRDYVMVEYCHVCSRSTDHTGEHDDLVYADKAFYDYSMGAEVRIYGRDYETGALITKTEADSKLRVGFNYYR